jgi:hypothetical protein
MQTHLYTSAMTLHRILAAIGLLLASIIVGFGVPLMWLWIGSQIQALINASAVSFAVAIGIFFGITFTYMLLLVALGKLHQHAAGSNYSRSPWMRGFTESKASPHSLSWPEKLFVTAALLVTGAFLLWFSFMAGSPLPYQ